MGRAHARLINRLRIMGFSFPATPSYATARRRYIRRYVRTPAIRRERSIDLSFVVARPPCRCHAAIYAIPTYDVAAVVATVWWGLTVAKLVVVVVVVLHGVWHARKRLRHAPPSPHGCWYVLCIGSPPFRAHHVTRRWLGDGRFERGRDRLSNSTKSQVPPTISGRYCARTRNRLSLVALWYTSPCCCGGAAAARGRWYDEPVASGKSSSADALCSARSSVGYNNKQQRTRQQKHEQST